MSASVQSTESVSGCMRSAAQTWLQGMFIVPGGECLSIVRDCLFNADAAADCPDARSWLEASANALPEGIAIVLQALSTADTLDAIQ